MAIIGADPSAILKDFVRLTGGCAIIDGGLATELEANGADLNDPLWSAKCLISSPELIRKVHLDYLEAGADILITASYQATIQGFQSKGLSAEQSADLLRKSVKVACEARDIFYQKHVKQVILIAASIGSYGAYLADGSEYSGDYGDDVNIEWLKNFHRERVQILSESGADLLAFETIPNKLEAQAYAELLEEDDISIPAWFAFNSKDGINVVSGDSLSECISVAEKCTKVAAVGINCTPPRFIHGLLLSIQKVTTKPILIYPNSGEMYDPDAKEWVETTGESDEDFVSYVTKWREDGACLIGGCCRTTPNTIRAIARALGTHLMMQIEDDDIKFGVLLKQGAEARVFESNFIGRKSIVKERFSKKYRHPVLDSKLTLKRLNAEARCMIKAKKLGVLTPALYAVDSLLQTLTFEYIEGSSVKDVLLGFGSYGVDPEKLADMAMQIGCAVAKLHDGGLVHGTD